MKITNSYKKNTWIRARTLIKQRACACTHAHAHAQHTATWKGSLSHERDTKWVLLSDVSLHMHTQHAHTANKLTLDLDFLNCERSCILCAFATLSRVTVKYDDRTLTHKKKYQKKINNIKFRCAMYIYLSGQAIKLPRNIDDHNLLIVVGIWLRSKRWQQTKRIYNCIMCKFLNSDKKMNFQLDHACNRK